jgi:putative phosphoserine phosphatase/1-acylglycerol-3-phosphate O-acyltransferase
MPAGRAAFFDLDGTLVGKPSLELRFFRDLRWHRKIPARNYLTWLAESFRIGLDVSALKHGNKMYLRGVSADFVAPHPAAKLSHHPPELFPAALQRVWWHALRGDTIVLVTGTLRPLAQIAASAIEKELLWRGVDTQVSVLATHLEVREARFTGRIAGKPVYGVEKAHAIRDFAAARNLSLLKSAAYGDSSLDRWMLASVGSPFAVNPSHKLRRLAKTSGWQILEWNLSSVRSLAEPRPTKWATWKNWKRDSEATR